MDLWFIPMAFSLRLAAHRLSTRRTDVLGVALRS
jgi:hypothetical protein